MHEPVMTRTNLTLEEEAKLDIQMAKLAVAAEAADTHAFLNAYELIDWRNRPPEDYIHATRMALAAGAHLTARAISSNGAQLYPNHAEMQKYARVLAPPKVIKRDLPLDPSLELDRQWILAHNREYRGKWVALRMGELLASGTTFDDVANKVEVNPGIFFTQVY